MAEIKFLLPSMGEGVMEATIINWLVNEGDSVTEDDALVEIATDKVDSDVPTPVSGKLVKILKHKDEVAQVGEAIAIIETETASELETPVNIGIPTSETPKEESTIEEPEPEVVKGLEEAMESSTLSFSSGSQQYLSPLVKSIMEKENISIDQINTIKGTGLEGRITKEDVLQYLENKNNSSNTTVAVPDQNSIQNQGENNTQTMDLVSNQNPSQSSSNPIIISGSEEIIEMDRVRKIIAESMLKSKQIAPHVTSFIESDVTSVVNWRNKNKDAFEKREGEKLTYMPIFTKAVIKAIQDFPMINISVEGNKIIKKKQINIGIATSLPDGNLIVPVIKNADQLSLSGLAKAINDLANRARHKKLKPEETQGATYTITNIGSFGNLMGTPIIPQPQVAILAVGAIVKKPAVLETKDGDVIAIRQKMFMSHTYDHRVVDGSLGGMFLKRVQDYLENWDMNTEI